MPQKFANNRRLKNFFSIKVHFKKKDLCTENLKIFSAFNIELEKGLSTSKSRKSRLGSNSLGCSRVLLEAKCCLPNYQKVRRTSSLQSKKNANSYKFCRLSILEGTLINIVPMFPLSAKFIWVNLQSVFLDCEKQISIIF